MPLPRWEDRKREDRSIDAASVEAFLRANPSWLADHPELYRVLTPPSRMHGDGLTDHMAAMIQAERAHAAAMSEHASDVLAAGRAAANLADRVREAVLALLRSSDAIDCVTHEVPGILGIDVIHYCTEALLPGARPLPGGMTRRLLGGRQVLFRDRVTEARWLHAEAAGLADHDVLVHVPGGGPPALLALLDRDRRSLDPMQGSGALAFLGRAVAAAMERR